jgi:hypothetical protein
MEHLFAPLFDYRPHPSEIRFENTRVDMLLRALNLQHLKNDLIQDLDDLAGMRHLSFESFDRMFSSFPWQLTTKYLWGYAANLKHPSACLGDFEKTHFWTWYQANRERYARLSTSPRSLPFNEPIPPNQVGRPLGMIFVGSVRGGLIIHDGPPQGDGPKIHYERDEVASDGSVVRRSFCVQSYLRWLTAVAKSGWNPDCKTRIPVQIVQRSEPTRPLLFPEAVRIFGASPAAILFGWLWHVAWSSDPQVHGQFRGRLAGEVCVVADRTQLASHTGLSERQIRTGLKDLKKQGLVVKIGDKIRVNPSSLNLLAERLKP